MKRSEKQLSSEEAFALFCNLFALTFGQNLVKSLTVTKIIKENKFEGIWDKLESKKYFKREPVAKYFRLSVVFM